MTNPPTERTVAVTIAIEQLHSMIKEPQDREAIRDCLARYSRGVDRFDRELILSAYHPDAVDDHGKFIGTPSEFADWALKQHADAHLSHQHCLFNHTCELDGDNAHTETYFMFVSMNRQGPPFSMTGGRYIDRFEKRNDVWAMAYRACIRDWAMMETRPDFGDLSTFTSTRSLLSDEIRAFMNAGPAARRDRSDPSYQRPFREDPDRVRAFAQLKHGATP